MTHVCPTGLHDVPDRRCYWHGCRCDGCRVDRNDWEAAKRAPASARRMEVSVPRVPWLRVCRALELRGTTPDEWLYALADKVTA